MVRKGNREVSFPSEEQLASGELENYLIFLDPESMTPYDSRPESITSRGLNNYISWLAELTKVDPEHKERSAPIYWDLRQDPPTLLYPTNPRIGQHTHVTYGKAAFNPRYFPAVHTHSHPIRNTFSAQDFIIPLQAFEGENSSLYNGFAHAVSTQEYNYLLLRTADSSFLPPEKLTELISDLKEDVRMAEKKMGVLIAQHALRAEQETPGARKEFLGRVDSIEKEMFSGESNIATYYMNLVHAKTLADNFRWGLYMANKQDGVFKLVTDDYIQGVYNDFMTRIGILIGTQ